MKTDSQSHANQSSATTNALRPLRIAALNKSGNVGKTTLVSCMMAPRMTDLVKVAYVDLTNAIPDEIPAPIGAVYGAHEFGEVENELLDAKRKNKSMIIDFGASDYNTTLEMFSQYALFKNAIDLFVLPCLPADKVQKDTISVIEDLLDFGIPITKIRVLFNSVPMRDKKNLRRTFSDIFEFQAEKLEKLGKTFVANDDLVMFEAEIFKRLGQFKPTMALATILADQTDYDEAIVKSNDEDEKFLFSRIQSVRALALNTENTLSKVFNVLVAGV